MVTEDAQDDEDLNLNDIYDDDEVEGGNMVTNEVDSFVSHSETADAPSFISTPIIEPASTQPPVDNLNSSVAETDVVEEEHGHFPLPNT
jgi:hypothetical protein